MKKIICFLTIIILISCGGKKAATQTITKVKKVDSRPINQTVPYEKTVILVGLANENGFKQTPFNTWYDKNFADYEVDQTSIQGLKSLLKDVKIKAFMGTWCSDSKRETPRFYKIMEAIGIDQNTIELITMSKTKDTPDGYEVGLNITNVPTFIFYRNDKEINRIVESPIISLEKDMLAILTGQEYKHTYQD